MTERRCECGHVERDHRSILPYYCQRGACKCPVFIEEDGERLDAEYERQRYEDMQERYR